MSETTDVEVTTGPDLVRLNEVVTYAEDHPREFDMVRWLKRRCYAASPAGDHVCGTAGCLAGTALRLYEDDATVTQLLADIIAPQVYISEHETSDDEYYRLSRLRTVAEDEVRTRAQALLRLANDEAGVLFDPDASDEVVDDETGITFDVENITSENVRRFVEAALNVELPRAADATRCPTCGSPDPRTHPATGSEGEVYRVCGDEFHDESPSTEVDR